MRQNISLNLAGTAWVAVDVGQTAHEVCRVSALTQHARPARGIAIRYRVLSGPGRFLRNAREQTVLTDRKGQAAVDIRFGRTGSSVVLAEIGGNASQAVYFRVNSNRCSHALMLSAPPTQPARNRIVKARITAVDQHNIPVTGAHLTIEAGLGIDIGVHGKVREIGRGEYSATLALDRAGEWVISARDAETKVLAARCIFVLPGDPHHIRLVGETDPRASEPYDQILLRLRLEDAEDNALDPHRIQCVVGGKRLAPHSIVADEARFLFTLKGSGSLTARISDVNSRIRRQVVVDFAPAWLAQPGLIHVGERFTTALYCAPTAGKKVRRARIRIRLKSERMAFVSFKPNLDGPLDIAVEPSVAGATVSVAPRREGNFSEQAVLGTLTCRCLGEGRSCIMLIAAMSPERPGWELCVDQKRDREKCLCINLIYHQGDDNAIAQGRVAAGVIAGVLGSLRNVERCCPHVRVEIHETPVNDADWNASIVPQIGTAADGTPAVTSATDQGHLLDGAFGQRTRCINFLMMRLAWPDGRLGSTYLPNGVGGRARGFGVVDPAGVAQDPNMMVHEAGHALGLGDGGPPENVMHPTIPVGLNVTAAECRTIWQNIDRYKC